MAEYPDRDPTFGAGGGTAFAENPHDPDPDRKPRVLDLNGRQAINASDATEPQSLVTKKQLDAGGGGTGGAPSGPAGGDLTGSYPNPQIASAVVVAADVNPTYVNGAAGIPSLRTLGTGATEAAAGNDPRFASGGGGTDLVYDGDFPANTPYTDGDIVVYNGVSYMCVRPTSAAPAPWPGTSLASGAVTGDKTYVHSQVALASTWTVIHNLGKYVAVEVVDSGDNVIIPNVHFDSVNQITLTFAAGTSGKAYVN